MNGYARAWVLFMFLNAMLSSIATAQAPKPSVPPGPLGQDVNPFIGTGGISYLCANNHPGAGVPFGMVRLSPDTVTRGGKRVTNMSGYHHGDPLILGFSHTRLVGTGAVDGGNLLVIPCTDKNVAEIVAVTKNSAVFVVPMLTRGSAPDPTMALVTVGPHPPPPTASRNPPTRPSGPLNFCGNGRG